MSTASSQMLNFRVKDAEKRLIDEAARRSGQSRTDFMRSWVMKGVREMGVSHGTATIPTPKQAPKAKATPKAQCPHPVASRVRTATGVKICSICGAKLR